jgi:ESS family glutamate:Na+ symporter
LSKTFLLNPLDTFVLSIIVLFVGMTITRKGKILKKYNIPPAVTGGLICAILIGLVSVIFDIRIRFDMRIRDFLLLTFFSCIGLGAKLEHLKAGGKALAILVGVAAVFLVLQDLVGITLAWLFGGHPALGVIAGSASFAGGHGTAIAWGQVAEAHGLARAEEFGIALATLGLITGGLIGGPIAGRLIEKNKLHSESTGTTGTIKTKEDPWTATVQLPDVLGALLALAICIEAGSLANRFLLARGILLPGFLTSMMVGIVLTNLADVVHIRLSQGAIDRAGEISLNVFLVMSLMAMDLVALATAAGPLLAIVLVQMLVITLFVMRVVFKVMGKDYDAAVICSGFAGLGLGATPVAIANMSAITGKYGPSPKAFLVVPLIGAFFIDILNAGVIRGFLFLIVKLVGVPEMPTG